MDHGVHESGEDAETVLCVSAEKMEVETCSCCADRCVMARERTVLLVRS